MRAQLRITVVHGDGKSKIPKIKTENKHQII